MTLQEVYASIGGDYDGVLKRLYNANIVTKFAKKFVDDPSFSQIRPFIEEKNWNEAFRMAHTLKGTALNLGFSKLATSASELTEAMRGGVPLKDVALYNQVVRDYNETIAALKLLD